MAVGGLRKEGGVARVDRHGDELAARARVPAQRVRYFIFRPDALDCSRPSRLSHRQVDVEVVLAVSVGTRALSEEAKI